MKTLIIIVFLLSLIGCSEDKCQLKYDHELKREIFFQCMKALPAGPQATKYNDWDEVVSECGTQASYMAYKRVCE